MKALNLIGRCEEEAISQDGGDVGFFDMLMKLMCLCVLSCLCKMSMYTNADVWFDSHTCCFELADWLLSHRTWSHIH